MEQIEIVCLANSRKNSGRCIAGKVIKSNTWLRPVSVRAGEEISEEERRYKNGEMPKCLENILIPVKAYRSNLHQSENAVIDAEYYWEKTGSFQGDIEALLDTPDDLWGTDSSSYQGSYDRFAEDRIGSYASSLFLIKPPSLSIIVRLEGEEFDDGKRKVRAQFNYNGTTYVLPVTDPIIEKEYLSGNNGIFSIDKKNSYLCLSVGLPYNGYCYKFVASIIQLE